LAQGAISVDIYAPGKRQKRGDAAFKTGKNLSKSLIGWFFDALASARPRRA
jgi:hypothetical protein